MELITISYSTVIRIRTRSRTRTRTCSMTRASRFPVAQSCKVERLQSKAHHEHRRAMLMHMLPCALLVLSLNIIYLIHVLQVDPSVAVLLIYSLSSASSSMLAFLVSLSSLVEPHPGVLSFLRRGAPHHSIRVPIGSACVPARSRGTRCPSYTHLTCPCGGTDLTARTGSRRSTVSGASDQL